jgi:transposase
MTDSTRETIGCDLGDKSSELCVVTMDGQKSRPKPLKTTRLAFREFFAERPSAHVVIEVGTHSRWVHEELTKLGHKVTVANPRRVKLITASERKTDKHDAELLARLGRADVSLLAPVTHRGTQAQADLAVAKARDLLVGTRTRLVLSIRGMVKAFGERLPSCDAECFHRRTRAQVPQVLKPALDPLYEALDAVDKQLAGLLVNAANYILGPFGKDSDLRRWGLKMASTGGKNGRKRATVAVARKLAVLMHRLWVTGEVYEPLRNTKNREQQQAA